MSVPAFVGLAIIAFVVGRFGLGALIQHPQALRVVGAVLPITALVLYTVEETRGYGQQSLVGYLVMIIAGATIHSYLKAKE